MKVFVGHQVFYSATTQIDLLGVNGQKRDKAIEDIERYRHVLTNELGFVEEDLTSSGSIPKMGLAGNVSLYSHDDSGIYSAPMLLTLNCYQELRQGALSGDSLTSHVSMALHASGSSGSELDDVVERTIRFFGGQQWEHRGRIMAKQGRVQ